MGGKKPHWKPLKHWGSRVGEKTWWHDLVYRSRTRSFRPLQAERFLPLKIGGSRRRRCLTAPNFFFFRGELAVRFRECTYIYIYIIWKSSPENYVIHIQVKTILCLHLKIIGTYPHHTLGLHCVEPNSPIFSPSRARPIWLIQRPTNWRLREAAKSQCLKWFLFRQHACAIFLRDDAEWTGMRKSIYGTHFEETF